MNHDCERYGEVDYFRQGPRSTGDSAAINIHVSCRQVLQPNLEKRTFFEQRTRRDIRYVEGLSRNRSEECMHLLE